MSLVTLGERLRYVRKELCLNASSKEVAKLCGISAPMYCQIENDKRIPSLMSVMAIYEATGVNLHWLLTGSGDA